MKSGLKVTVGIFVTLFYLVNVSYAKDCTKIDTKKFEGKDICTPQCVDFVECYIGIVYPGNASKWWSTPPPGYHRHENGKSKQKPKKMDIVYENAGQYGHVSVIKDVNEKKKTITIAQTNYPDATKCLYSTHTFTYKKNDGKYKINGSKVVGWLSKK